MTLNIALSHRSAIALSADFRLTWNGKEPLSTEEQKLFVLAYGRWTGFLCYTGVARFGPHKTAQWLTEKLTHAPGERSPDGLINALVSEGNNWIKRVPTAQRFHTFTLAAFLKGVPHVYVVSNFQWAGGQVFPRVLDEFRVDRLRPKSSRVVLTGLAATVSEPEIRRLQENTGQLSMKDLRYALATTNRVAASRSNGRVSENCAVAHMLPDGSGELEIFGNMESNFNPALILRGSNVATIVPEALIEAGTANPYRLVGATWTATGSGTGMFGAYRALSSQTDDGWPKNRSLW